MKANLAIKMLSLAVLLPAAVLLAGCKTAQVDWNGRVGVYTFNQAVADLGQPSKQTQLNDGKTACQWITLHGSNGTLAGGAFSSDTYGMGAGQAMPQSYKDHVLELTFDKDGKLVSWARNY